MSAIPRGDSGKQSTLSTAEIMVSLTTSDPPIAELAQPMLRLAGHRMNPATNGPTWNRPVPTKK